MITTANGLLYHAVHIQSEVDLIVRGTHGRRGVDRQFLGRGTELVIRTIPVSELAGWMT